MLYTARVLGKQQSPDHRTRFHQTVQQQLLMHPWADNWRNGAPLKCIQGKRGTLMCAIIEQSQWGSILG